MFEVIRWIQGPRRLGLGLLGRRTAWPAETGTGRSVVGQRLRWDRLPLAEQLACVDTCHRGCLPLTKFLKFH